MTLHALTTSKTNGFLPRTHSDTIDRPYTWPLSWVVSFTSTGPKEALELFSHSHPTLCNLIRDLGEHFHKAIIQAPAKPTQRP